MARTYSNRQALVELKFGVLGLGAVRDKGTGLDEKKNEKKEKKRCASYSASSGIFLRIMSTRFV
jgi:hypothetical protein